MFTGIVTDVGEVLSVEERAAYLETIRLNGAHLLSVINDILTLSKIEAGKMTVERIVFPPARLAGEVVALMHHRARDKGIAFEIIYQGLIPEHIESDPTRVRQICEVAEADDRMPQKSTYFYPKLITGLVMNPLW